MEMLSKKWVLILINSLLVLSIGSIILLVPLETIKSLILVVGSLIAFVGLVLVFGAFHYAKENKSILFWLFQGLFNIVIGGIVIFYPEASIKFLLVLAGLWTIVLGVYQFSVAFLRNLIIKGKFLHKLNGFLSTIIGLLLIFNPELFMDFGFQILGFLLLIIGSGMLYFAFLLKGLGHSLLGDENVIEDIDSE